MAIVRLTPLSVWLGAIAGSLPSGLLLAAPPLVQLPGSAGCVTETGSGGRCGNGVALIAASAVEVTLDGRHVYVATAGSDSLAIFDRDAVTGALTQKAGLAGCISDTGTAGACVDGVALDLATSVEVTSDGRRVYVASANSDAVVVFDRDVTTGQLTQKAGTAGCVSETGTMGQCAIGVALDGARSLALSPNERNLYLATGGSDAVVVFDVDAVTGALTQKAGMAGCISESGNLGACEDGVGLDLAFSIAVSPDGRNVYVAAAASNAVTVFDRDVSTGTLTQKVLPAGCIRETAALGCADGTALDGARGVTVSPDGKSVYVASQGSGAVAIFDRDAATGELTQKAGVAGCISDSGAGPCTDGVALTSLFGVAASVDDRSVYVASLDGDGIAMFDRDAASGTLIQQSGEAGCATDTGNLGDCRDGLELGGSFAVEVSPDGRHVYVSTSVSDGVAIFTREVPPYDVDGDGEVEALTDGLLLLRHAFGFTGASLVTGAVDLADCTRCTAPAIDAYLQALLAP